MFYFTLDHRDIANQVSVMINAYNNLSIVRSVADILSGRTNYIVELHGRLVIGAVGIERQSFTLSEIKHLVVREEWRRQGLARFLIQRALNIVNTRMAYCTISEDNIASMKLFESLGFRRAGEYAAKDHKVILLTRTTPQWEQIKPLSQSAL